jgi:Ca2+/Na+ antiporter
MADKLQPNLTSHNTGTVIGNAVMAAGLTLAFVVGIISAVAARRAQRS